MLRNKKIILGVCGGIAAYKSVELLRLLTKAGADVNVIMTSAAEQFVAPLTFQTLSSNPVHTDLFNLLAEREIGHISLADKADLVLIAPATANIIGKISAGIADDLLTTTVMATKAPILFAPAMNVNMFTNKIYQENESKLKKLGYFFQPPVRGALACGYEGEGKLADPTAIFETAVNILTKKDLLNLKIMVTAGPTREEIDPVRFISNHSSGKMGYAIAMSASRRGAKVLLIAGPTNLPNPENMDVTNISTAIEMRDAVMSSVADYDVVIKAAAVADYRPVTRNDKKIKKNENSLTIELVKNPDILAELGAMEKHPYLVGFAAETDMLVANATKKLKDKKVDMIVANDVSKSDAGFNVETNRADIIFREGRSIESALMSKTQLADMILDNILLQLAEKQNFK